MHSKQELLLGKQAIAWKYITSEQLRACIEIQIRTRTPLVLVFLQQNIISEENLRKLMQDHLHRKEENSISPGEDLVLCRILQREELLPSETIAELFMEQQESAEEGISIAELLLNQNLLPFAKFLDVYTRLTQETISCLGCHKEFRLVNLFPGKKVRCKYCKQIIDVPSVANEIHALPQEELEIQPAQEDHFAGYEIIEEVAQGGMGIIYRAQKQATGQIVALKVLGEACRTSDEAKKRFAREAQTLSRLKHPNIVSIIDIGIENEVPYFSMEFVDGQSLENFVGDNLLPIDKVVDIILKVSRGLAYAHQSEVIHRDIKPSNILLDSHGEPHLTDFGLAKCMDSMTLVTRSGTTLGTPYYMSPEQAKGQLGLISPRSDIYSLGVVFYELLTGVNPFRGENTVDIYQKILTIDPVAPSTLRKGIPKKLDAICLKCLKKDAFQRYKNAQLLVDDIIKFKEGKKDPWYSFILKLFGIKH